MLKVSVSTLIILILCSCKSAEKFEKTKWNQRNDVGYYSNRERMLDDLLVNHHLKGSHISRIRTLFDYLEISPSDSGKSTIYFSIITDFGSNIDPQYTKDLYLHLNSDSIVTSYEIIEDQR